VGTWGTGIFSDDTAGDVRDQFRDAIGDGLTSEQATRRLVEQYRPGPHDPDGTPVFWLALAVTQWQTGRLLEFVKAKALRVIADGSDLARWEGDPKDAKKRKAALAKVAKQLAAPPPPAKPLRKRWLEECDLRRGELFVYRMASGTPVHFRVVRFATDAGGTRPVCEILRLAPGKELDEKTVSEAPVLHFLAERKKPPDVRRSLVWLYAMGPRGRPAEKITRPGIVTEPLHDRGKPPGATPVCFSALGWRDIDSLLEHLYGIQ
jgi:hypothetical protein